MDHSVKRFALHEQVARLLRTEILGSKSGDRLDSITALSKRFSVSEITVRNALLFLSNEGLVELRHGSGTFVADPKARQQVALIFGVHPQHPRLGLFSLRVWERMHFHLSERNYRVHTYWARHPSETKSAESCYGEFLENLNQHRICGLYVGQGPFDDRWRAAIEQSGLPTLGNLSEHSIGFDVIGLVRAGVRHLLEMGRRKIAFMDYHDPMFPDPVKGSCWKAFRDLLREHGCELRKEWVRVDFHPSVAGAGYAELREIWMARDEKPNGLLLGDDVLFPDVATAVIEIGIKIPDELMIVTHANKGATQLYPFPTTRIETDPDAFAQSAAKMLVRLMNKETVAPRKLLLPFEWVGKGNRSGSGFSGSR
ncbi:MAG: substrate-binding domain-containing protein, partial [Verrucomicrobia bacterium]|nr:substrate-binding domain-containing protein [Verrucomicrobiota bacterium]